MRNRRVKPTRELIANYPSVKQWHNKVDKIDVYIDMDKFRVFIFTGRKVYGELYGFSSLGAAFIYADKRIAKQYAKNVLKQGIRQNEKKKRDEFLSNIEVGDIFINKSYYSDVVEFYQVVERKSKIKFVLKKIETSHIIVESGGVNFIVYTPIKDEFISEEIEGKYNKSGMKLGSNRYFASSLVKTNADKVTVRQRKWYVD